MIDKTRGLVLNYIRYRETSIIVRIFTEAFGLQSYIVNNVRSPKGGGKTGMRMALFQPFTLLELVVYHQERANLQRIKEMKCTEPLVHIPLDFAKSGMVMFLTEVLNKTLKLEEANEQLFEFLHESVRVLDALEQGFQNFHLQFLLKLPRYLGFAPPTADELLEEVGPFISSTPEEKVVLERLLQEPYGRAIPLTGERRRQLLQIVLQLYKLHVANFQDLKSLAVLQEMQE